MIELRTKYRPGTRTFTYYIFRYGWPYLLLGIGCLYVAFKMYFGSLHGPVDAFLNAHPQWYIDVFMLSEWSVCFAIAFFLVAFIVVSVEYRMYSFKLDDHAFHLRRGLIRVQEITIPYRQISNVHIEQPYHWRLFGLAMVDVTMTSSSTSFHTKNRDFLIPVIDKSLAHELSHFLIQKTSGEDDEDDEYDDEEDSEDIRLRRR